MTVSKETFVFDFAMFCAESMTWCANESEQEASLIFEIINNLVEDIKRRSEMSEKALSALNEMKDKLNKVQEKDIGTEKVSDLIKELSQISTDESESKELINPIIECLQFQDRLRQNLENITKMVATWLELRGESKVEYFVTDEDLQKFGKSLLKHMTSIAEKRTVRSHIKGLPEDEGVQGAIMF